MAFSKALKFTAAFLGIAAIAGCRLNVTTTEGGRVYSESATIDCGVQCTFDFPAKSGSTTEILHAEPAEGYRFIGWSGACTGTETCTIKIGATTGNKTVKAQFATSSGFYTIIDTLDLLQRQGGFITSSSIVNGNILGSFITVPQRSELGKIKWSGMANPDGLNNGTSNFILRAYRLTNNQVVDTPVFEQQVSAVASLVINWYGYNYYTFEYDAANTIALEGGDYLFSVIDPNTDNLGFGWHAEKDRGHTTLGSGGGFKPANMVWRPLCDEGTFYTCRGKSLYIEGRAAAPQ